MKKQDSNSNFSNDRILDRQRMYFTLNLNSILDKLDIQPIMF